MGDTVVVKIYDQNTKSIQSSIGGSVQIHRHQAVWLTVCNHTPKKTPQNDFVINTEPKIYWRGVGWLSE